LRNGFQKSAATGPAFHAGPVGNGNELGQTPIVLPSTFEEDFRMMRLIYSFAITATIAGLALAFAISAEAKGSCVNKAGEGTGNTEKAAKFQAFEAILQATDWGTWASWMSSGQTPGYTVSSQKSKCTKGTGLGITCVTQATLCKT
jgi:hypothetical protein